jgi:hypothetical protein
MTGDVVLVVQKVYEDLQRVIGNKAATLTEITDRLEALDRGPFHPRWSRAARERIVETMLSCTVTLPPPADVTIPRDGVIRAPDPDLAELWDWFQDLGGRYDGEAFPAVAQPLTRLLPREELLARLGSEERIKAFAERLRIEGQAVLDHEMAFLRELVIRHEEPKAIAAIQVIRDTWDRRDEHP